MINVIIALFFICLFFGYIIYGIYYVIRMSRQDKIARELETIENHEWSLEQAKAPKYFVAFEIESGTVKYSKPALARIIGWAGNWNRIESRESANNLQDGFYKQGYFVDSDGITYPACNVKNSRIVLE